MLHSTGTALLTIRAWCEEGSQHPLRAEIRLADDVVSGFRSTITFVHPDAVVEAVRDFLDSVLCSAPHEPTASTRGRRSIRSRNRRPMRRLGAMTVGSRPRAERTDRKSTRLNSSHVAISYAVFCLKKK